MILNPPTGLSATLLIVYYICTAHCAATTCQWEKILSSDCKKCQRRFTVNGEPTNWILKSWYARCRTHHINRHYEWDSKQGQERSFYSLHILDIYIAKHGLGRSYLFTRGTFHPSIRTQSKTITILLIFAHLLLGTHVFWGTTHNRSVRFKYFWPTFNFPKKLFLDV